MLTIKKAIKDCLKYGQSIVVMGEDKEIKYYALNDREFIMFNTLTKERQIVSVEHVKNDLEGRSVLETGYEFKVS